MKFLIFFVVFVGGGMAYAIWRALSPLLALWGDWLLAGMAAVIALCALWWGLRDPSRTKI
jgi:hypothetical protein